MKIFEESFERKLIYIFALDYKTHAGLLKIGETTLKTSLPHEKLLPNCEILNQAAKKRIAQYTNTAGIKFNLLYTELAENFRDHDVHRILKNSNFTKISPPGTKSREWFKISLETAIAAIQAAKLKRNNISGIILKKFPVNIEFREEQKDAISKTVKAFKKGKIFLWNAKMRFGKTLCALEVVRRMNFAKTIIVTHRPVVDKGWFEDFGKIFGGNKNFSYRSKNHGDKNLSRLEKNFIYFASIQDLRGSETVGGNFAKNAEIFSTDWDLVIVDEAHEGTTTALGDKVIKNLVKPNTKFLALSGTPFNILEDFSDNIFTWDYVQEQRAKNNFYKENFCDHNPYEDLPEMKIFTYNLGENFSYIDFEDKAFNFREFFRTQENIFVHEDDVKNFLHLLTSAKNYPFATEEFRNYFRHSLWILPGVKEARAFSQLLQSHDVFKNFKIVNVVGDGDDGEVSDALKQVQTAIKNYNHTITLSCGRLTTGVTIPAWTAVFMLAGSYSTSAASYLQTIFRVQNPGDFGGKLKKFCYVFDFAPDRTLKMIAESVKISSRAGKTTDGDRKILGDFLNFCPVISVRGSEMKNFSVDSLFRQLKRAYVERTVKNGFDDAYLYSDELLNITDFDLKDFEELKKIVGVTKKTKADDLVVNSQGLDNERHEKIDKKIKRRLTDEEKILLKQKAQRRNLISVLRGVSIRLPLMIYGSDISLDEDFKIEMFLDDKIVDSASWAEFMPKKLTREKFKKFIRFYDKDIFIAAAQRIRNLAKDADNYSPTERIKKIADLFACFKNPDKETVLTPFKVVNLHLTLSFGGWDFFAENPPQFVASEIFSNTDAKILEINSKTGLYPLLVAYNFYRTRLGNFSEEDFKPDTIQRLWNKSLAENIFVICKTPMAEKITRRTLAGYSNAKVNIIRVADIKNFSAKEFGILKFDAVVGNPPYQKILDGDNKTFAAPVYHEFLQAAWKISDKVSLIHPARCLFNAGATPSDFNKQILSDEHLKVVKYFQDSNKLFPNTDIKGGIAITFRDAEKIFGAIEIFIPFPELQSIYKKVCLDNKNFSPLSEIIFPAEIYHFTDKMHKDFPNAKNKLSKGHDYDLKTSVFEKLPEIFLDSKPDDGHEYIKVLGLQNARRIFKFIRRDYVNNPESLEKFKILVPAANGSGAIGEVLSTPLVGLPLVGCTQTFITVGAFDTAQEAAACIAYIKTKFCRAMLGILKVTQHNPPQTWSKVPLQDFTASSDIDWSKSIAEIDLQLYAKYNLSAEEIKFIEDKVRAMN